MSEPLYRQALRKSWDLAWHHKYLWVFGLFAAFLGQMGLLELFTRVFMAASDYALYPNWLAAPKLVANSVVSANFSLPADHFIWFIALILVMLGFVGLGIFAAVSSQGALVRASAQFIKNGSLPSITDAWHTGMTHFWRVFFINLFKKTALVILAVVVGWGTLTIVMNPRPIDLFLFFLLFLLAVFVGMMLSFLAIYSVGYVIVEEYSLLKAIESAWKLFLKNWLVSIEVALVVLFLNVVVALIGLAGLFLFFLPTLLTWLVAIVVGSSSLWVAGMIVGMLFFTVFIIWLGSLFMVFTTSVWTDLFMKMHHLGIKSRILHLWKW